MYQKKIVICGGHHNSALVVAEALIAKGYQVFWFGHKYSMLGDQNPCAEYTEVTSKNIPFYEIKAGKFQLQYKFWQNFLRFPLGFYQSLKYLWSLKPDLIFSFGGYLALPVAYCGWLLSIPVVTHEQTTVAGVANKLIARISRKVFVTFESSLRYFPSAKVRLTGLPLRKNLLKGGRKLFNNKRKTIYITGGKQGAHCLNRAVFEILPELLKHFNIIHQTGSSTVFEDIKKAREFKSENYIARDYFFEHEIGAIFNSADFVVSRAGAHIIYELLTLQKPAILIPIPWASYNEQYTNAKVLEDLGLAKILPESELAKDKLGFVVKEFAQDLEKYRLVGKLQLPSDPTGIIVREVEKLL